MEGFTLTILDSTGIQEYIFGSNKLKENIGASHLLVQVSRDWLFAALELAAAGAHNFGKDFSITTAPLEADLEQNAELIYSGGGNVVMLSRTEAIAKQIVGALSRMLLERAPGLEISAAHRTLSADEKIGGLDGAYNDLLGALKRAKQQRQRSLPQLGLGVTMACRATGLPAVHLDREENRYVSAEIDAKLSAVKLANQRLREQFGALAQKYEFSDDFDDFGRSQGDSSYIAVIHADGNGMGQRFEQIVALFGSADQNRACLDALRALSQAVEQSGREALQDALNELNRSFGTQGKTELDARMIQFATGLQHKQAKAIFPVRPLVFGGDDLTLVCDGRLGLALAAVYLKAFHYHTTEHFAKLNFPIEDAVIKEQLKQPAYACAGIAIVKAHYPFARAYALSEELCGHAKTELRKEKHDGSAMDWHFAAAGINADLLELRKRQYGVKPAHSPSGKMDDLTMRPVTVGGTGIGQPWREWNALRKLIETFANKELWRDRHNKVVALREALRAKDVERFRRNYQIGLLPELPGGDQKLRETGWSDKQAETEKYYRSGYFDAIEALEFYLPIEPVKEEAS